MSKYPWQSDVIVRRGSGDPETVVAAPPGTLYENDAATHVNDSLFIKASGTGNTGWDRLIVQDRATGLILIGQNVQDHGSNAGIQYASAVTNRAQLRMVQYGGNAGAPGLSILKSRGPIGGPDVGVADGDPLFRMSCVGMTGDLSVPLAAFITIQVPTGGAQATYTSTEYELQLVPLEGPINGRKVMWKITSQGVPVMRETALPAGGKAAGLSTLDVTGQVVVANPNVKAGTRFMLTVQDGGALATGNVQVISRVVSTSFTIASSVGAADAGAIVYWQLYEGV